MKNTNEHISSSIYDSGTIEKQFFEKVVAYLLVVIKFLKKFQSN